MRLRLNTNSTLAQVKGPMVQFQKLIRPIEFYITSGTIDKSIEWMKGEVNGG